MNPTTTSISSTRSATPSMTLRSTRNHGSYQIPSEDRALTKLITQFWTFEPKSHRSADQRRQPDRQSGRFRTIKRRVQSQEAEQTVSADYFLTPTNSAPKAPAGTVAPAATDNTVGRYEEFSHQAPELDVTDPNFGIDSIDLEDWENIYGENPSPREVRERMY